MASTILTAASVLGEVIGDNNARIFKNVRMPMHIAENSSEPAACVPSLEYPASLAALL